MNDIQRSHTSQPRAPLAPPSSTNWTVPGRKPDLRASLTAHRRLALWVGAVTATLGLAVALIAGHPKYLAEASIRVAPNFPKTLQEDVEPRFNSSGDAIGMRVPGRKRPWRSV